MLTASRSAGFRARDLSAPWRHVDWILLVTTYALTLFGTALIWSATHRRTDAIVGRQVMFLLIGSAVMAGLALLDYRRLRDYWMFIYAGGVLALALALSPLGVAINGNGGWLAIGPIQLQPTEFAKVATIVGLAGYFSSSEPGDRSLRRLLGGLVLLGIPFSLVMLLPDLGSGLVFLAVGMGMLVVAGVPIRQLALLIIAGLIGVFGILNSGQLDDYQIERLTAFVDPNGETRTAGLANDPRYHLKQARIAISSGGFTGYGLGNGPQTRNGFVPEQETDFIFSVAGEELGFLGAGTMLLLLGVACWRVWRIAQLAADEEGTLLCVGVLAMLVFHVLENVGMNIGIMPITGIPLPLISYGGSNLLTMFIALGIVQSVHMHRFA